MPECSDTRQMNLTTNTMNCRQNASKVSEVCLQLRTTVEKSLGRTSTSLCSFQLTACQPPSQWSMYFFNIFKISQLAFSWRLVVPLTSRE